MKKYIVLFFLVVNAIMFSQESEGGQPTFRLLLNSKADSEEKEVFNNLYLKKKDRQALDLKNLPSIIDKVSLQKVNNERLINEANSIQEKEHNGIDIYGKIIDYEINLADINKRFLYQDRYYNIVEISSENAKSLQAYFKDYNLPKGATLFIYDDKGRMTLGSFTSNNNPKEVLSDGYNFITQPVIGDKIFLELSYPMDSQQTPILNLKSVVHGFKGLYDKGGAFGTSGACNKNTACNFGTGLNDVARNIKSVGLILANYKTITGGYTFKCSGTLLNNGKQDGTPYFLTAEHCVGAYNTQNANWKNELLVLFNYEAKTCDGDGSDASSDISTNSVLGCELLADSPKTWRDFALLKLNSTKEVLAKYKVCYAGWDNNANAYTNTSADRYSIHHPSGDVKKISIARHIYPTTANYDPLSVGDFLSVIFKTGVVEGGSSGGPLFNSQNRLIGSLSTSDNDLYCGSTDTYWMCGESVWDCAPAGYSRFSSNYPQMAQWLNPNNTSIQAIGPYCPSSSIAIGPTTITNPTTDPSATVFDQSVDINFAKVHPSQTFGKRIYSSYVYDNGTPPVMLSEDNIIATRIKLFNGEKISGVYKVIGCNKLQQIDEDVYLKMKNPSTSNTIVTGYVVGVGNNRVIVRLYDYKLLPTVFNEELQIYRIEGKKLVLESWVQLMQGQSEIQKFKISYSGNRLLVYNETNNSLKTWSFLSNSWIAGNSLTFSQETDIKLLGDNFFVSELSGGYSKNKVSVYKFQTNSSNFSLINTLSDLYNNSNTLPNSYSWKILNVTKNNNKANSFYINYIHKTIGDPFNRIVELDLDNQSYSHFNLGNDANLDFSLYDWTYYSSYIIGDNKIIQVRSSNNYNINSPNPIVLITLFRKNEVTGVWYLDKRNYFYQSISYAINQNYIIQHTGNDFVTWPSTPTSHYIFNVREIEYLFHPETIFNNNVYLRVAGYNMIKNITDDIYWKGASFGKEVYTNEVGDDNIFYFNHKHINGNNQSSNSMDNKTIIFSDFTKPIEGAKMVKATAKYSVVMKPGFSISSSTGVVFSATVKKNIASANIPTCSFTFDDMLDPQLGKYSDVLYLKGQNIDPPYYGEIVMNEGRENSNLENTINRSIKVYPNPTKDIVYLDFMGNGKDFNNLEVYSADAKKIITKKLSSSDKAEVDLSQYPTGIYILKVVGKDGKSYAYKIIKK